MALRVAILATVYTLVSPSESLLTSKSLLSADPACRPNLVMRLIIPRIYRIKSISTRDQNLEQLRSDVEGI
jgi:hypothetical protein